MLYGNSSGGDGMLKIPGWPHGIAECVQPRYRIECDRPVFRCKPVDCFHDPLVLQPFCAGHIRAACQYAFGRVSHLRAGRA